uniref:Cytochrome P450 like protein n=1 Tax=Streptomyces sp. SCSIO 1666 TaxID=861528 RepID=A0A291NMZ1_9ACTN|nr:cytochrome P450 like protein [Streptomyces sp. SCSIO 1666]
MTAATNALWRELQLVHAAQWLYAVNGEPFVPGAGDPYARLVRGFEVGEGGAGTALASVGERGPVWRSRLGPWVVTGPTALRELSVSPDLAVSAAVPQPEQWLPGPARGRGTALARDLARRAGTRTVRRRAALLRERAGQAAAGLAPGPADLVADFAEPLTAAVYATLLDVPREWLPEFTGAVAGAAPAVDALLCPQTQIATERLGTGVRGLRELFGGRDRAEADLVLAVAGARAAADLLGDALRTLLGRPGEWARLRSEPGHAARVVGECLRSRPLWRAHPLVALGPAEVAGTRIAAGDSVTAVTTGTGGGPDPLPVTVCAALLPAAAAQTEHALAALAARFPVLRPDGEPVRARRAPVTRRLVRLPARLGVEETR